MPIVTAIVERRGLMEIAVDGSVALRVRKAHYGKNPLCEGEEIDLDAYTDRVASTQFADGYEAALSALDYSNRSAKEVAAALRRRGYVQPCIEAVLARLVDNRIIDDRRYAERLAELQSRKPVGVYAFRRKLRAKGISEEDAAEALSAFDDGQQQAAALEAAQKLCRRYADLPARERRSKLSQALARRGFGWETIESAMDQLFD